MNTERTPLRVVSNDPLDIGDIIRRTLENVSATYIEVGELLATIDDVPPSLLTTMANNYAANESMLSTLRHPAGVR